MKVETICLHGHRARMIEMQRFLVFFIQKKRRRWIDLATDWTKSKVKIFHFPIFTRSSLFDMLNVRGCDMQHKCESSARVYLLFNHLFLEEQQQCQRLQINKINENRWHYNCIRKSGIFTFNRDLCCWGFTANLCVFGWISFKLTFNLNPRSLNLDLFTNHSWAYQQLFYLDTFN